ncbi:MAG: xanthine dehydrogenase family protein subunit M [Gemmatimonadota bacterium]
MLRLPVFSAHFPTEIADAVRLKTEHGQSSAYVAGGTDLIPNMKRRQQTPSQVIDIRGIRELAQIKRNESGAWTLGAGVTLAHLIRHSGIRAECAVLAEAAATISTPILQNMGTVGGNLLLDTRCNYYDQSYEWRKAIDFCMKKDGSICWVAPSSPRCWAVQSSDLAPVMIALGARVRLTGSKGDRTIPVAALYRNDGMDFLTKQADELLTAIEVPPLDGARATYQKLRRRGSFDFPVLGVAAWARSDAAGIVREARVVLGAVGSHPIQSVEAEAALVGHPLSEEVIDEVSRLVARPAKPLDNTDFTIGWRKDMVPVFVRRALSALVV